MTTVWKYHVDKAEQYLPKGAKVVHVEEGGYGFTIWCEVDPDAETVRNTFSVYGTGHPLAENAEHITTWRDSDGPFIWHLYRVEHES